MFRRSRARRRARVRFVFGGVGIRMRSGNWRVWNLGLSWILDLRSTSHRCGNDGGFSGGGKGLGGWVCCRLRIYEVRQGGVYCMVRFSLLDGSFSLVWMRKDGI